MTYSQKLRDPRWQKMRLRIFERDDWRCQNADCGSSEHTLAVHHKEYLRSKDPWEYPLTSLITYCEKCHELLHKKGMPQRELVEGEFYAWNELPNVLGYKPRGYLTQVGDRTLCGCIRLDYNPDAPDIVLVGPGSVAEQALKFAEQREYVPIFVKAEDAGWEYCGQYRVEGIITNPAEIEIHRARSPERKKLIAKVVFLEKKP